MGRLHIFSHRSVSIEAMMVFLAHKTLPEPMRDSKPTRMRTLRCQGKNSYLKKIDEERKLEKLDKKLQNYIRSKKKGEKMQMKDKCRYIQQIILNTLMSFQTFTFVS